MIAELSDRVFSENRSVLILSLEGHQIPLDESFHVRFVRYDVNQVRAESVMTSAVRVAGFGC